jgi:hypothetical protein
VQRLLWSIGGDDQSDEVAMNDFSDFQREIADAARATFRALRSHHADEHFYAFALMTDSGAMTVLPAANSIEALSRAGSIAPIDGVDYVPQRAPQQMWRVTEWAYASAHASPFNEICGKLADEVLSPQFARSRLVEFSRKLHADMIDALRLLDRDGFFGTGEERARVTLFVSISDDDAAATLENDSARILNPPAVFERFLRRGA